MILVDANLLIYGGFGLAETCRRAGLPGADALRPLAPELAIQFVDSWLAQPYVQALAPGDGHWPVLRSLLRNVGTAGNLTSDAHLAAVAIERGADIYSTDLDFARFPGLRHVDPLA